MFIICSLSLAEDRDNGRLSILNVFESVAFTRNPNAHTPGRQTLNDWRITTSWMRSEEDVGKVFEFELRFHIPGVDVPYVASSTYFAFNENYQRLNGRIAGDPPFVHPGVMLVEGRIRQKDGGDWISQNYPITVTEISPPP